MWSEVQEGSLLLTHGSWVNVPRAPPQKWYFRLYELFGNVSLQLLDKSPEEEYYWPPHLTFQWVPSAGQHFYLSFEIYVYSVDHQSLLCLFFSANLEVFACNALFSTSAAPNLAPWHNCKKQTTVLWKALTFTGFNTDFAAYKQGS